MNIALSTNIISDYKINMENNENYFNESIPINKF